MNHQFYAQIFGALSVVLLILNAVMFRLTIGPFRWMMIIAVMAALIIMPMGVWELNCVLNGILLDLLLVGVWLRVYIWWISNHQPKKC